PPHAGDGREGKGHITVAGDHASEPLTVDVLGRLLVERAELDARALPFVAALLVRLAGDRAFAAVRAPDLRPDRPRAEPDGPGAQNSLWLNWMSRSRGMSEKKCGPVVSRKKAKEGKPHQTMLIGFGSRYGWVMVARQRTSRIPAQLLPSRFAATRTVSFDGLVWSISWKTCGAGP